MPIVGLAVGGDMFGFYEEARLSLELDPNVTIVHEFVVADALKAKSS